MLQSKELVAASTIPMILSILSRGESYGYAIIREIREVSNAEIEWSDGMLYPVLRRPRVAGAGEIPVADRGRDRQAAALLSDQ